VAVLRQGRGGHVGDVLHVDERLRYDRVGQHDLTATTLSAKKPSLKLWLNQLQRTIGQSTPDSRTAPGSSEWNGGSPSGAGKRARCQPDSARARR
jgi:hypothetical protein